ncbi:inositol 2-dehydrogenase/D-chiro-inositol 3-dehydrogenase [Rubritalea halochordaticola]|uniref:Inositol 2-dehydrogenase/D-chiro-inositol 3-dehydrogenase n=2 Tax=Rubritalea halochordaticola TaxID=714537 RepID=A0ABP9UX23_9BACT
MTITENIMEETRRNFIKKTGTVAALSALPVASYAQSSAKSEIKVALIGCGGRGTGAASQTLNVEGTKLVAIADAFGDNLKTCLDRLKNQYKEKVDIPKERQFVGFDAYKGAIDAADVVILTTPPGFRPIHFDYAVAKGKHVFMEKPVATDAAGVRSVLENAKKADEKNLKVVVGLQRHYDERYIETVKRVHGGEIGDIVSAQCYWNSAGVWVRPRTDKMTEMEYQMRNWYYFNWLCGDHIVEQHVHNIDVINWFMGDQYPEVAQGMGGRQVRVGKDFGEIFDHHFVEFTYGTGAIMNSQCRHTRGAMNHVTEYVAGTKGTAGPGIIRDHKGKVLWRYKGRPANPYQVEHNELYRHIREDKPLNNAYYGAKSTMTGIMGRMATYCGKELKWDEALNSEISIIPKEFTWESDPGPKPGPDGIYPCAIPGKTKVI